MKKGIRTITTIIAAIILSGTAACGGTSPAPSASSNSSSSDASRSATSNATETTSPSNDGKVLVAYYSRTGTTEQVAKTIAQDTDGKLFRIEISEAYPEDYTQMTEVAQQELNDDARPAIKGSVDNMDQYSTVFIGYPIWWGQPPMAVLTFLDAYDWQGKTVIPFCTSGGSSIDGSLAKIEQATQGATILEGLRVTNNDQIQPWLDRIGIR